MAGRGAPLGNRNGAKGKEFERRLRACIEQDDWVRLRKGFEALLDACARGDMWALQMVRDTLDGKPKQQIEAVDEEGRSVAIALIAYSDSVQVSTPALPAPDTESTGLRH